MKVEMLAQFPEDRQDGTPWPETGGLIDLPKAEADELIRVGYARLPVGEPIDLTSATKAELVAEADRLGLDTTGTKAELVDRIGSV